MPQNAPAQKTQNDPSDDARPGADWSECAFPTIPDQAELAARLQYTLKRLDEETWLPIALRELVKPTCDSLIRRCCAGTLSTDEACARIERLADEAFAYDELILKSSVLCQIRTLDMELNDERYAADDHYDAKVNLTTNWLPQVGPFNVRYSTTRQTTKPAVP